jgi:mRNA-degrading endonuclease RelE of RelBE toxin-antitoxin system
MRLALAIDRAAERDFARLPRDLQELYRLRVGDYRIVYAVNAAARTLTVIAIAGRRDVYEVVQRRYHPRD